MVLIWLAWMFDLETTDEFIILKNAFSFYEDVFYP